MNTYYANDPTFYSGSHEGHTARIDYLVLPLSWYEEGFAREARTHTRAGFMLQLADCCRNVDHVPISAMVDMRNLDYSEEEWMNWNSDKLMRALLIGDNRQIFFDKLEQRLSSKIGEIKQSSSAGSPSGCYRVVLSVLREVGVE
eukprot:8792831-Lingulodinium_polyedra.AAC.1